MSCTDRSNTAGAQSSDRTIGRPVDESDRPHRRRRWGDARSPPAPAVVNNTVFNAGEAGSNAAVSDQEALQALLQSAQMREQEKTVGVTRERVGPDRVRHRSDSGSAGERHRFGAKRIRDEAPVPPPNDYYGPGTGQSEGRPHVGTTPVPPEPQKPNFAVSGALANDPANASGNVYKGIVLKFREPPEARAPNTQWRLYVFRTAAPDTNDDPIDILHIAKQSAYLMGRNKDVCDVVMAHASISSQHAVLQYRAVPSPDGPRRSCQPYLMDLESTNGSFLNGVRLDPARYYQLKRGDVLTFGSSTREYVLLSAHTTSIA
jgi:smad nuclear-interacting protein 1